MLFALLAGTVAMADGPGSTAGATPMVASWYGERFRGRPTASGEPFDPDGFTAAHPSLPFGTWLALTHPETGATARVRVNDRGPNVPGRQLDVAEAVAEALGIREVGVAALEVEVLGRDPGRTP